MPRGDLPHVIRIDDVSSGKIDPSLIYEELDRLKREINLLRNDMASFVKAFATVPPDMTTDEYHRNIASKLLTLQQDIRTYCLQYNKLLPIINLSQIKLGHEVETLPPSSSSSASSLSANNNGNAHSDLVLTPNTKLAPGPAAVRS